MAFEVPVVDITPYVTDGSPQDRAAVAAALGAACREVGFIQVVGHGIPDATIDGLAAAMDEFFALDLDRKKTYVTPPEINRGYAPPKTESLSLSLGVESANRMNDFFEAFNIGDAASDHPGLDLPVAAYNETLWPDADALTALLDRIVTGSMDGQLAEFSRLGRERVAAVYQWDMVTDQYEALIQRLAASRKR